MNVNKFAKLFHFSAGEGTEIATPIEKAVNRVAMWVVQLFLIAPMKSIFPLSVLYWSLEILGARANAQGRERLLTGLNRVPLVTYESHFALHRWAKETVRKLLSLKYQNAVIGGGLDYLRFGLR